MKDTANHIFRQIVIQENYMKNFKNLKKYDKIKNDKVIQKGEPIFMRVNETEEVEFLKNIMMKK